ncbi:MAG: efflux RND transporter periplasmic adaptor subunit [Gammaproteobacteria bacterium]|nr:efflux RND transporter periplasmic adaptor subunit [Gammaproteobacteria bacterium]
MYRTNKLLFILVLGSAFALGLQGCGSGGEGETNEEVAEETDDTPAIPVETAQVQVGNVSAFYSGTATLEAEEEATVVAKVGGEIMQILVEEGDRVETGQLLAKIDDERLKLEVLRARANLGKLKQEYVRNKELHENDLVSSDAFERLKYDLADLEAALELAELELAYTGVRAPIDGVISERLIKVGNMITLNEAAFKITDFEPMLARLHVPERELNKLRVEQEASLTVDALPDLTFTGVIDRISPVVDANTGTFKVTVEINDQRSLLKPGMFGRVNVIYDIRNNTLLAPRSAIITEDAQSTVFLVADDIAQRKVVETGYTNNGSIEILEGLQIGDSVVTVGQTSLKDGAKVTVVNAEDNSQTKVAEESTGAETP